MGFGNPQKSAAVPWHCRIREIPTLLLGILLCSLLLGMPLWHPAARMDGAGILGERHGITANSRGWNAESVHAPATPRVTEQGFSCGLGWFFLGQAEGISIFLLEFKDFDIPAGIRGFHPFVRLLLLELGVGGSGHLSSAVSLAKLGSGGVKTEFWVLVSAAPRGFAPQFPQVSHQT